MTVEFDPFFPIYLGRVNRIQFKLCHEYCETCYVLDKSKDNHKCLSCLPEYQYDYLYFTNQTEKNPDTCVLEGYYYDTEKEDVSLCSEIEYKYYINTTNNKKICFPDKEENECPSSYPLYNETTKECYYCDFDRFKDGECTADDLTMESCTECDYDCFVLGGCDFKDFNTSNDDFFEKIKSGGFLKNYTGDDGYLRMSNANGYGFHLTTVNNELNSLKEDTPKNHSIIDLKDCADLLRSQNGLDSEEDLVILKYENENPSSDGIDKGIQYEVYLPNSETKLDLSVCANTRITIYVPIELSERTQKVYDNMKKQGYNLFDPNDRFYRDICTPYKSIDGTDVVLFDRVNFYEQNKLICQKNCEFEDYTPESKYMKCDCKVTNEKKIETKEPEKVTKKSVIKSFYNVLKYSNYKVLRCYNLVFRKVTIKENVGSILSNIYFIGYIIAFFIFCYNRGAYFLKGIEKLLKGDKGDNTIELNKEDNISIFEKKQENIDDEIDKKSDGNKVIKFSKDTKNDKSVHTRTVKDISSVSENKNLGTKDVLRNNLVILEQDSKRELKKTPNEKESKKSELDKDEEQGLSNYELNALSYNEALMFDNRKFLDMYWYLLRREHIIIFTFVSWNDYNLFSVKLSKLFLTICSDMAFNVFFFSDESMHKLYTSGGENDFVGQIAQMVYSTIISQLLQIYVEYLIMTDSQYYYLKKLKKNSKLNKKLSLSIIKCIKNKLIAFYISTTIFFLFFWYSASAFCAVYANTQRIFVTDSYMSSLMGLTYPFALYFISSGLRFLSLKLKGKKKLRILYVLSGKIPLF